MPLRDLTKVGHWPTLLSAFLYFDISFMIWASLGPIILAVTEGMRLETSEKFTLVAVPVLAGAFFRLPLGIIADRVGGRITGLVAQIVVIIAVGHVAIHGLATPGEVMLFGAFLGVAGASFSIALPQASRWYPPQYQGLVMGIAGAGNIGVAIDSLFAPWIAQQFGWQTVYLVFLVLSLAVLGVYAFAAKDAPAKPKPVSLAGYGRLFSEADSLWFMFFYFITFGGFVGLASVLPLYFTLHFHVSTVAAGLIVALIVAFGSIFRPVGGYLADRIGGVRALLFLFGIVSASYFAIAFMPEGALPPAGQAWNLFEMPLGAALALVIFSLGVMALGMGNGAVFQLLPQRFAQDIGAMSGVVGSAGGLGGFFLAQLLGLTKSSTGGFTTGFLVLGALALFGLLGMLSVRLRWRRDWGAIAGARI